MLQIQCVEYQTMRIVHETVAGVLLIGRSITLVVVVEIRIGMRWWLACERQSGLIDTYVGGGGAVGLVQQSYGEQYIRYCQCQHTDYAEIPDLAYLQQ